MIANGPMWLRWLVGWPVIAGLCVLRAIDVLLDKDPLRPPLHMTFLGLENPRVIKAIDRLVPRDDLDYETLQWFRQFALNDETRHRLDSRFVELAEHEARISAVINDHTTREQRERFIARVNSL